MQDEVTGDSLEPTQDAGALPDRTVVSTETPRGVGTNGPLPTHVLHAVALMMVGGARYEDIESATGVRTKTLKEWSNGSNEAFQRVLQGYREAVLQRTSQHQWRLIQLLDKSYVAIERALDGLDVAVASKNAWELMDRVFPQKQGPTVDVNIGFQHVHQEINQTFAKVGERFAELVVKLSDQNPDQYLRDQSTDTYTVPEEASVVESPQPDSDDPHTPQ